MGGDGCVGGDVAAEVWAKHGVLASQQSGRRGTVALKEGWLKEGWMGMTLEH